MSACTRLAAREPSLAKTGEAAKSGPIGLAVILLLCIACYFLFKSMSRHLRKVREDFPADAGGDPPATPETVRRRPRQPGPRGSRSAA